MVVNDALQLCILIRNMAQVLKIAQTDLRWHIVKMCLIFHRCHILAGRQAHPAASTIAPDPFGGHKESVWSNDTPEASNDGVEWKLARTRSTAQLKTVPKLMTNGISRGNSPSSSNPSKRSEEACSSTSSCNSPNISKGRSNREPPKEVMVEGIRFLRAPTGLDLGDDLSLHFPNPKVGRLAWRTSFKRHQARPRKLIGDQGPTTDKEPTNLDTDPTPLATHKRQRQETPSAQTNTVPMLARGLHLGYEGDVACTLYLLLGEENPSFSRGPEESPDEHSAEGVHRGLQNVLALESTKAIYSEANLPCHHVQAFLVGSILIVLA
ncbi:hypothetical protein Cgig2_012659 [Carnegiea gigantea]|uniref:Uncharacterized protein n=1 Tax=Carnegiea gigantea TaxID=171969 RepID=A0A9Q1K088_9CARY|nr:hypothetical protein Cgig2_012659 [Carnegiea gigantea]